MQSLTPTFKNCPQFVHLSHTPWTSFTSGTNRKHSVSENQKITMWLLGKIKENMESISLELGRHIGKSEEDMFGSSRTTLSHKLHNNILTPDKIPEFCLPPRLCKRSPLHEADTTPSFLHGPSQVAGTNSKTTFIKRKDMNGDASVGWQAGKKPLPFSAEVYGLSGIYESPNTRRKESLFHSNRPVYIFDRSIPNTAPHLVKQTGMRKKTLSDFLPPYLCKSLSEMGSTESEAPSSSDSRSSKSSLCILPAKGRLKGATSCPSLIDSSETRGRWRRGGLKLTTSVSSPPNLDSYSLLLSPPASFSLDVPWCQKRHQNVHVLPLKGRGKVRLFAEHVTLPTNTSFTLYTVRVHLASVEDLQDDKEHQTMNCVVNLCLTPGKLQQRQSTSIRNCRSPVFNEYFFFTELRREDLLELQLKVKVVDKSSDRSLKRGAVIGVITKPLSQLLSKQ